MKYQLVIALLFLAATSQAQEQLTYEDLKLPIIDGIVTYQEVVDVPGASSDELYHRAKLWFADFFRTSEHVIELDSKEQGVIIGNGNTEIMIEAMGIPVIQTLHYTIKLEVKEERVRYSIYSFTVSSSFSSRYPIEEYFTEEGMFKKNGRLRKNMYDWYLAFQADVLSKETSIREGISTRAEDDWE